MFVLDSLNNWPTGKDSMGRDTEDLFQVYSSFHIQKIMNLDMFLLGVYKGLWRRRRLDEAALNPRF